MGLVGLGVLGGVAYEEDVVPPAHVFHGDGCDLADKGVEGEGDHDADTDTLGAGTGVEDFGGNDPYGIISSAILLEDKESVLDVQESGPLVKLKLKL